MKLVVYKGDDGRVLLIEENLISPVVMGNRVSWEGGSVEDTDSFILLENDVDVGEVVSEELKALDKKGEFIKPPERDLAKENEELKARLEAVEMATVTLMDFM